MQKQDAALSSYPCLSKKLDMASRPFMAAVPLGWMLAGITALAPARVCGASPVRVAISLGGILLAERCLGGLAAMLSAVAT